MKDGISLPESVKIAGHSFTIRYPYIFRELLHAIDQSTGQHVFTDESKVVAFSEMIYQVLTDNGWLPNG